MTTETTTPAADGITFNPSWGDVADASAEADATAKAEAQTKARPPRNLKQVLDVKLTAEEKAALADKVAQLDEKLQKQEADKKAAADRAKAEIELTSSQMSELLATYRAGVEPREVECVETFLFATNQVTITRVDSGEVVSTRSMTTAERQVEMFAAKPKEDVKPAGDEVLDGDEETDEVPEVVTTKKKRKG